MALELWMWAAFGVFVVAMLLVDLLAFGGRSEQVSMRRAVGWSVGWTLLGLAFAGFLWRVRRAAPPPSEYLAGLPDREVLSIDNLFVFAADLHVLPGARRRYQRRVLIYWGVVGALVFRGDLHPRRRRAARRLPLRDLRLRGVPRSSRAYRMATHHGEQVDPSSNTVLRSCGAYCR